MNTTMPETTTETTTEDQLFLSIADIPHRIREIAIFRGLGYTFREIAEQLNITPQAVSLMLSRHRRVLKSLKGSMELSQLSARAANALGRYSVTTRAEARERKILEVLQNERNCGRKTLDELERWLAVEETPAVVAAPVVESVIEREPVLERDEEQSARVALACATEA